MGKTFANERLIDASLARGVALAIAIDDKGTTTPYVGTTRANMDELKARPPAENEDPRRVVLRGHTLRTGLRCSPDDVAHVVLDEMQGGAILVSIDELRRAASPAGREWRGSDTSPRRCDVPRLFSEGGGLGISVTWTTQSPQRIPLEAFDQSETIGIFRMRGRALPYLQDLLFLDDGMLEALPELERGQWVLYQKSEPWDGRIYRF